VATYAELQALILDDLHRSDLTSQVQTAISNAVAKLGNERFYFNETQVSFTVTATSDFDLATYLPTILEFDELRIWRNGSPIRLERAFWDALADSDETLVTGTPSHWAVHHQMMRLYPAPDTDLRLEITGLKQLSVTAWCSLAPTLVRATAEVELYGLVTHDMQGAERAAQFVTMERNALMRRTPTHAAAGEVEGYL
jgi:hypothetical protein